MKSLADLLIENAGLQQERARSGMGFLFGDDGDGDDEGDWNGSPEMGPATEALMHRLREAGLDPVYDGLASDDESDLIVVGSCSVVVDLEHDEARCANHRTGTSVDLPLYDTGSLVQWLVQPAPPEDDVSALPDGWVEHNAGWVTWHDATGQKASVSKSSGKWSSAIPIPDPDPYSPSFKYLGLFPTRGEAIQAAINYWNEH